MGVLDRIEIIKDKKVSQSPKTRPEYIYQIPLNFIPGVGAKTLSTLLKHFGTEMDILHRATKEDLLKIVSEDIANKILNARNGNMKIQAGGGGVYGKII